MNNENLRPNPNIKATPENRAEGNKKSTKSFHLRKFWREEFMKMSEKEIDKYIDNPRNPYLFRVFCKMWKEGADLDQYYKLATQCYGNPATPIEVSGLPKLDLSVFGEEDDDENQQEVC